MSSREVRITVRGAFDALSPQQRDQLQASAPEHDVLTTEYTPEGHLTYDPVRPFFTFRFLAEVADEKDIPDAAAQAELAAEDWLSEHGYAWKNLTSTAVDMSEAPLGARGRKGR